MNLEEAVSILPTPAALVARDTRRADEVTTAIKQLDGQSQHNAFDQAGYFLEVEQQAHWATKGYESIYEYYKGIGIDLSKREIQYRSRVARMLNLVGVSRDLAVKAKISKLKIIAELDPKGQIVDPDTHIAEPLAPIIKRLVVAAPETTTAELREQVDELLGKGEDEEDELTWLNLPVRRDAKKVVTDAIALAKSMAGDTIDINDKTVKDLSDAAALELIASDFLADPNHQAEALGDGGDYQDTVMSGEPLYQESEEA